MAIDQIPQLAAAIIALGAVSYAINFLWVHVIRPVYRLLVLVSEVVEIYPTILIIAQEFAPNGKKTLGEQVYSINVRLGNIEGQLEALITDHK